MEACRSMMIEGLVDSLTNEILPLKSSVVFAEVNGFTARVSAKLVYFNSRDFDVGCVFVFPQNSCLSVVDFEAKISEREIGIEFCELNAPDVHCVYTPELERDGNTEKFVVYLGEIARISSVEITVSYIEELKLCRNGSTRFILPSVLTPKTVIPQGIKTEKFDSITTELDNCHLSANIPSVYKFNFRLEIVSPCLLAGVWSPTHELRVDAESKAQNASKLQVTLDKTHTCDRDVEIFLFLSQPLDPYVATQEGLLVNIPEKFQIDPLKHILNFPVLMVTLTPDLRHETILSEFIFCVDLALRTSAFSLRSIKESLILLVKSLPITAYFNIVVFYGSFVESLFPEPVAYVKINLNEALKFIKSLCVETCVAKADNDFFTAMEKIALQTRRVGCAREVFLFSASIIQHNHDKVYNLRKISPFTRFFSFSLMPKNCHRTLRNLCDVTGGKMYILSYEEDRLQSKVISALQQALEPAVSDIEIKWCLPNGYDVIQTPHMLQAVYSCQRLIFYGFLLRPTESTTRSRPSRVSKSQSTCSVKEFWMEDDIECRENEADDIFDMETGETDDTTFSDDVSYSKSVRQTDYRSFYKMQHSSIDYDVMNGNDVSPTSPTVNGNTDNTTYSRLPFEQNNDETKDVINEVTSGPDVYKAISLEMLDIDNGDESKIRKIVDAVLHGNLGTNADGSEMHFDGIPDRKGGVLQREVKQKVATPHLPERDSGFGTSLSEDDIGSCSSKSEKCTTPMSPPQPKVGQTKSRTSQGSTSSEKIPIPRNTGLISVTGVIGTKKFNALVPFPLERDVTCEGDLSTIHQLAGKSLINDLELSLDEAESRDDFITNIVHVSKVAHLTSKYTSVVSESCDWSEPIMCLFDKIPLTEKLRRRKQTASTNAVASTVSINEQQNPEVELQDFTDRNYTRSTSDNLSDSDDTILTSDNISMCSSLASLDDLSDHEQEPESHRTSLNIPKIKVQFVDKKYPTNKAFIGLMTAQLPQGNWRLNSKFAQTLSLSEEKLQKSCPLADETYYPDEALWELLEMENWPDVASIWATCIALTWLEQKCAERKEEWTLVAAKANEWLRTHPFPRGFKLPDVMTSAKQALALINKEQVRKRL